MKYRKGLEFEITVAISEGLDFLCKRFSHSSKNIQLLVFASFHVVELQQTLFVVKMTRLLVLFFDIQNKDAFYTFQI